MRTRSWRKWWVAATILLLSAQGAIAASPVQDFEERALQSIARHADREAAMALVDAWQQRAKGGVSPASVALNEGLSGHYLTAKHLMARVVSEHPEDASARLGSLVLVLLEGNPPTCRQAIEDVAAVYPENAQLQQRYSDVLESMGLSSMPLPKPPETDEAPASESQVPVSEPVAVSTPAAPATEPKEIRPVQAESVREQLLRQLAESQARQAKEEATRQQRLKDEQARKRREEAARLAAEKQRREEALRQAAEQQRQQEQARLAAERQTVELARQAEAKRQQQLAAQKAATQKAAEQKAAERHKAEQVRLAEQQKVQQTKLAAEQQAEQARRVSAQEAARLATEQRRRLEQAEQDRWLAARRQQPTTPVRPPEPPIPTPPAVEGPSYVLKPVKIANRRVWIGEERQSVHARLGRPKSVDGPGLEQYAGLSIWYDAHGKVSTFQLDSAWYYGPGGVRPGLTLKEVLKALPNSDGLFHLRSAEPDATSSLYVLSTVDGTIAELQFNDEAWLSTMVRTTTPAGATHLYEELLQKGPVRRLAPDYVFALEARRRPLP